MSNDFDPASLKQTDSTTEDLTADLRGEDNFKAAASHRPPVTRPPLVKPLVHVDDPDKPMSAAAVLQMAKQIEENVRKQIAEAKFDSSMSGQVVRKEVTPITDFSKITLDEVYDLSIPIEAKPFMSADGLVINLKDTNYEPRWANKNPQRIGELIGKGFTYITPSDLRDDGERKAIEPSLDAQGHYSINDVVAMKIDKATYYRALRYAHERAVSTTNSQKLHRKAANTANGYMKSPEAGVSADYVNAANQGKMKFYSPDVEI